MMLLLVNVELMKPCSKMGEESEQHRFSRRREMSSYFAMLSELLVPR